MCPRHVPPACPVQATRQLQQTVLLELLKSTGSDASVIRVVVQYVAFVSTNQGSFTAGSSLKTRLCLSAYHNNSARHSEHRYGRSNMDNHSTSRSNDRTPCNHLDAPSTSRRPARPPLLPQTRHAHRHQILPQEVPSHRQHPRPADASLAVVGSAVSRLVDLVVLLVGPLLRE